MILSQKKIKEHIENGTLTIEPFDEKLLKHASYTLTLSNKIYIPKEQERLDTRKDMPQYNEFTMDQGGYALEPGAFVITESEETLGLPPHICCLLSTRGSMAQAGLDFLNTSTVAEPGTNNQQKFEVKNNGCYTVILYPGMPVVKGVFSEVL